MKKMTRSRAGRKAMAVRALLVGAASVATCGAGFGQIAPPGKSTGTALVYVNGPVNFLTGQYIPPTPVKITDLGSYDLNANYNGSNSGLLNGKYLSSSIQSLGGEPNVPQLTSATNNFSVDPTTDPNGRASILYGQQVENYYYVTDFRNRFFNNSFIDQLQLPAAIQNNLENLQYRSDFDTTTIQALINKSSDPYTITASATKPAFTTQEGNADFGSAVIPWSNAVTPDVINRIPGTAYANLNRSPFISYMYDPTAIMHEYCKLMENWVVGTNQGMATESAFTGSNPAWDLNNIVPALQNGVCDWMAHRYTGQTQVLRIGNTALAFDNNNLVSSPVGSGYGGTPSGEGLFKGMSVNNTWSYGNGAGNYNNGIFPITNYLGGGQHGGDLNSMMFTGIFYDLSQIAGLGDHKVDLLVWKTVSLINANVAAGNANLNVPVYTIQDFAAGLEQAAVDLFPNTQPGHAGQSLYDKQIFSVLTERGIPLNGVSSFKQNLPAAIGNSSTLMVPSTNGFGSNNPESVPGATAYGNYIFSYQGYTHPDANAQYVAYQFYKYSNYSPNDSLIVTNGTFTTTSTGFTYNNNGTYFQEFTGRELENLVLLAPGRSIYWVRDRVRADSEAQTGFWGDVAPLGFRVTQATSNGYSFKVTDLGYNGSQEQYGVSVVDPSAATLGAANYTWQITDYQGNAVTLNGSSTSFYTDLNQPFTIELDQSRNGISNSLVLDESGSNFARNNGNAFVDDLTTSPSYSVWSMPTNNFNASSGDFSTASNWFGATTGAGVPGVGQIANFRSAYAISETVNLSQNVTLAGLNFDSTTQYSLTANTGVGLTLDNSGNPAPVTVQQGTHTISAPIALTASANITIELDAVLTISGNISGNGGLYVSDPGTVLLSGTNSYTAATSIGQGATLAITSLANGGQPSSIGLSTSDAGNLVVSGGGVLQYWGPAVSTDRLFSVQTDEGGGAIDSSGSGSINFTNTGAMGFGGQTGPRTLTLQGTNTANNILAATVGDNGGPTSLTKAGVGTWVLTGSNSYTGTTEVSQGTLTVTGSIGGSTNISVEVEATLNAMGAVNAGLGTSANLTSNGATTIGPNLRSSGPGAITLGTVTLGTDPASQIVVSAAALRANRTVLVMNSLTFTSAVSGQLDLQNNDAIIHSGSLVAVEASLLSGASMGSTMYGYWAGPGIMSSTAAADTTVLTALGYIQNTVNGTDALYSTFDGQPGAATDVLIKYTYYGDANLDGKVDGSDYSLIDNGYLQGLSGWYNGDFNYDGMINGSDYTLIDNAFNTQGASLTSAVVNPSVQITGEIAGGTAAVPEPATGVLLSISFVALIGRRNRYRKSKSVCMCI